jgi:redox-sensitive bicupin YhaK (pirin superfamily)
MRILSPRGQLAVVCQARRRERATGQAQRARRPFNVLLIGGASGRAGRALWPDSPMNTRAELSRAFEDFRSGRMGEIVAR